KSGGKFWHRFGCSIRPTRREVISHEVGQKEVKAQWRNIIVDITDGAVTIPWGSVALSSKTLRLTRSAWLARTSGPISSDSRAGSMFWQLLEWRWGFPTWVIPSPGLPPPKNC